MLGPVNPTGEGCVVVVVGDACRSWSAGSGVSGKMPIGRRGSAKATVEGEMASGRGARKAWSSMQSAAVVMERGQRGFRSDAPSARLLSVRGIRRGRLNLSALATRLIIEAVDA
jgi:hypothetical protein